MRIEFEKCMPGMVLNREIMRGDTILVSKGQKLTPGLINKLKVFNIEHIDIISENEYTINPELRNNVKEALKNDNIIKMEQGTTEIIDSVLKSIDSDGNFSNLRYDLETFDNINSLDHSVRVAVFSIVLAHLYNQEIKKYSNGSSENLVSIYDVALAALMHEKGKSYYNFGTKEQISMILQKEKIKKELPEDVILPIDEYDEKYLPIYSFCAINDIPELSEATKKMVLYSAEADNHSGPLKTSGYDERKSKNISIGARIIHICDIYDNFLAHFYQTEESLENIITVLGQAISTRAVDEQLASLFLEKVPIYPVGAKLNLSNEEQATVVKNYTGYTYTTRPSVKLHSTGQVIDLRYATNITVDSIVKKEHSLEQVIDNQVIEAKKR